jgi:VCBS repeat-containing protein
VLLNDSGDTIVVTAVTQPTNGTASINTDGTVRYTPNASFNGIDTLTYTITDANGDGKLAAIASYNIAVIDTTPASSVG